MTEIPRLNSSDPNEVRERKKFEDWVFATYDARLCHFDIIFGRIILPKETVFIGPDKLIIDISDAWRIYQEVQRITRHIETIH